MSIHHLFKGMFSRVRQTHRVLGTPIDALDWSEAIDQIRDWAAWGQSRYVCICNVHSVVTARHDADFAAVLEKADLATPDGAPIAWMLRRLGAPRQQRINGPDLMWRYCEQAAVSGESIYLYGGSENTLDALRERLLNAFPGLRIAGHYSPPYRALTVEEDADVVDRINDSGASTVWVSLGCPKQEQWMAAHRGRIHAVMIGVGAAFDYHAGTLRRAPLWMQQRGLEWLYRLCTEPRRLWRRYVFTNTRFLLGAARQLLTDPAPVALERMPPAPVAAGKAATPREVPNFLRVGESIAVFPREQASPQRAAVPLASADFTPSLTPRPARAEHLSSLV